MLVRGNILIQCDWNQIYREGSGKFWISYKCSGQTSVHSFIVCEKLNSQTELQCEDDRFEIKQHNVNYLEISYNSDGESTHSAFKPASKEYCLHGSNKKVVCLDAAAGGLGLSCAESSTVIKIWETSNGTVRRELSGHVGDIYTAKFFPSGVVILSGGADMQLKVWSAETGQCAATMTGHKAGILDIDFVERGRNVVSCSRDGTAKLWDVSTQKCLHTYQSDSGGAEVNACTLHKTDAVDNLTTSPDEGGIEGEVGTESKLLLLARESGRVQAFSLNSKQQVFDVASPDSSAVNCVMFINDKSFVCGTQVGTISAYDLRNTSTPLYTGSEGRSYITSITPYKQGFLYSTGDGSVVCVNEMMSTSYELSGPDCDAVYRVVHAGSDIFTSCRDGYIRSYSNS